jgi:hypothetical protein
LKGLRGIVIVKASLRVKPSLRTKEDPLQVEGLVGDCCIEGFTSSEAFTKNKRRFPAG